MVIRLSCHLMIDQSLFETGKLSYRRDVTNRTMLRNTALLRISSHIPVLSHQSRARLGRGRQPIHETRQNFGLPLRSFISDRWKPPFSIVQPPQISCDDVPQWQLLAIAPSRGP